MNSDFSNQPSLDCCQPVQHSASGLLGDVLAEKYELQNQKSNSRSVSPERNWMGSTNCRIFFLGKYKSASWRWYLSGAGVGWAQPTSPAAPTKASSDNLCKWTPQNSVWRAPPLPLFLQSVGFLWKLSRWLLTLASVFLTLMDQQMGRGGVLPMVICY